MLVGRLGEGAPVLGLAVEQGLVHVLRWLSLERGPQEGR